MGEIKKEMRFFLCIFLFMHTRTITVDNFINILIYNKKSKRKGISSFPLTSFLPQVKPWLIGLS